MYGLWTMPLPQRFSSWFFFLAIFLSSSCISLFSLPQRVFSTPGNICFKRLFCREELLMKYLRPNNLDVFLSLCSVTTLKYVFCVHRIVHCVFLHIITKEAERLMSVLPVTHNTCSVQVLTVCWPVGFGTSHQQVIWR